MPNKPWSWRDVLAEYQSSHGMSHNEALELIISEWLIAGDAGPLLSANAEGLLGDGDEFPVLSIIADMLACDPRLEYHLKLVRKRRGARRKPDTFWRGLRIAQMYMQCIDEGATHEDAIDAVKNHFVVSASTVKQAVWAARKIGAPKPPTP
jgi:hypothetical protein